MPASAKGPQRRYKGLKQYFSFIHVDYHRWSTLSRIKRHGDTSSITLLIPLRKRVISLEKTPQKKPCFTNTGYGDFPLCVWQRICLSYTGLFSHQCVCSKLSMTLDMSFILRSLTTANDDR
ncbi:hypothetical protein LOAG_07952 [Loa loa]|uniref:Uncharacterized protein n=1 Tax=Loa loa TaxID=7209 RepID=A0A1S0TVG1_LOALO|nr:hypothetical protein LOAG_07952 [Loa loa]EFO20537.2 hypothetical protein LOAG_07952 [Loa loa]